MALFHGIFVVLFPKDLLPLGGSHILTTQQKWVNKAECSSSFVSADGN